jgi:hypothetical protein
MIYEIICNETGERYIGSTYQSKEKRLICHLSPSNKASSKQIIRRGNFNFKTLETLDNPTKEELLNLEKKYILELVCINKQNPLSSIEEKKKQNIISATKFYNENKNDVLKRRKEWYEQNKIKVGESRKVKHQCECGMTYTYHNKSRHLKSNYHINNIKDGTTDV